MDAFFVRRELVDLIRHLGRQLARRAENQNLHRAVGGLAKFDCRNPKRGGFSGSRHRLTDHIVALEEDRNGCRLDRRGFFKTEVADRF